MKKLLCMLLNHKYREIWNGGPNAKGGVMLQCTRCSDTRWRI